MVKLVFIGATILIVHVGLTHQIIPVVVNTVGFISSVITIGTFLNQIYTSVLNEEHETIMQAFKELNYKMESNFFAIVQSIGEIPIEFRFILGKNSFNEKLTLITGNFEQLVKEQILIDSGVMKSHERYQEFRNDKEQLLRDAYNGIRELIGKLMRIITENMNKKFMVEQIICRGNESFSQAIFNLYVAYRVVTTEYYVATSLLFNFLELSRQRNFTQDIKDLRREVNEKYEDDVEKFKNIHKTASRVVWKCDTGEKRYFENRDLSYYELDKYTKIIMNEVDLPSEYYQCIYNCESKSDGYADCVNRCQTFTSNHCQHNMNIRDADIFLKRMCYKQRGCHNQIHNCMLIKKKYKICLNPFGTFARYQTIVEPLRAYTCDQRTIELKDNGKYHTTWYMCNCEDDKYYFSSKFVEVSQGSVAIGVKFDIYHEETRKIIYLRIQEGKLGANATIDPKTISLTRMDDYAVGDIELSQLPPTSSFHRSNRINLSQFVSFSNGAITGVGFIYTESGGIQLRIRVTEFDFETGHLSENSFYYESPLGTERYPIDNRDIPTKSFLPNRFDSKDNQYVEFQTTGENVDGGQSTIPFIDTQLIASDPPSPITGIGLFIRGQEDYGGFLTPLIHTYDISAHVEDYINV